MDAPKKPSRIHLRGFASMNPDRQREIARSGGAAVPASKRSFSQDRALAQSAGRRGGQAPHTNRNPAPEKPECAR